MGTGETRRTRIVLSVSGSVADRQVLSSDTEEFHWVSVDPSGTEVCGWTTLHRQFGLYRGDKRDTIEAPASWLIPRIEMPS
eukprot:350728-Rhodomonas_salina.1